MLNWNNRSHPTGTDYCAERLQRIAQLKIFPQPNLTARDNKKEKHEHQRIFVLPLSPSLNVDSPCIQVCKLNDCGVCIGCFRTIDEIAGWTEMTESQKRLVICRFVSTFANW